MFLINLQKTIENFVVMQYNRVKYVLLTERKIIMKKFIAFALVCLLSLSSVALAAEFKDMPDDWSTAALTSA